MAEDHLLPHEPNRPEPTASAEPQEAPPNCGLVDAEGYALPVVLTAVVAVGANWWRVTTWVGTRDMSERVVRHVFRLRGTLTCCVPGHRPRTTDCIHVQAVQNMQQASGDGGQA